MLQRVSRATSAAAAARRRPGRRSLGGGASLAGLATPALVVDASRVASNAARMRAVADRAGLALRPHVKTHKTLEGWAVQAGRAAPLPGMAPPPPGASKSTGMVVSTLAEAAFFAPVCDDIVYGVPLAASKLPEVARLMRRHPGLRLSVLVDSPEAAEALLEGPVAPPEGARFSAHLKLDTGYGRAGVDPRSGLALRLARALDSGAPGRVRLDGVYSHSGHSYACRTPDEVLAVARDECRATSDFCARLEAAGVPVPRAVGVGATPTCAVMDRLTPPERGAVTEMHPGNYLFYDVQQVVSSACSAGDVAATVLCQVVGSYPDRAAGPRVLVDAGALALSKDTAPAPLEGFGRVLGHPDLQLVTCSQEVAAVAGAPDVCARLPVGTRVRVLVNHSCLAAACFDRYHVVAGGDADDGAVLAEWRPTRGW